MVVQVEVFSAPGCGKCGRAKQVLRTVAAEFGAERIQWREVDILEELDHAVSLGVMSTPAIAINGELAFASLPSEKKLRQVLKNHLAEGDA